jgi:hypothetical protein
VIHFIKKFILTSKFYWKFRHFFHKEWWLDYHNSYMTTRRNFFSEYVEMNRCRSIFEFGCASGPNLRNIQACVSFETLCFGYDINRKAVEFAASSFDTLTSFFSHVLNKEIIESCLSGWGCKSFDLAIYDRVLYLLSEEEVRNHFSEYSTLFNSVIIDDFHNSSFVDDNGYYQSKCYETILSDFGFAMVANDKSEHVTGDAFYERSARRLIFCKV